MTPQPGFRPYIATLGEGPRRALALHCTLGHSGAWAGFARHCPEVTFIAPDMPSHGRSADWDGTSSFGDTVYAAALDCLTAPMDVIGHSFGAVTALRLGLDHPDRVRTLTLFEPVFFAVAVQDAPEAMVEHDRLAEPFLEATRAGRDEDAARAFNRMWSDGPRWAEMPERARQTMTRAIRVVQDTAHLIYDDGEGLLPRLSGLTVPTLILRGSEGLEVVRATNRGLAARIPGAQEAVIDGAGHMAPITHPGEVAAVWKEFLAAAPA